MNQAVEVRKVAYLYLCIKILLVLGLCCGTYETLHGGTGHISSAHTNNVTCYVWYHTDVQSNILIFTRLSFSVQSYSQTLDFYE